MRYAGPSATTPRREDVRAKDAPNGGDGAEEVAHLDRVLLRGVEKVETVLDLLDTDRVLVGVVLQDELLEVEEGALVVDLLADLDERSPSVLRGETGALGALRALDDVLDLEDLLQNGGREDLRAVEGQRQSSGLRLERYSSPRDDSPPSES